MLFLNLINTFISHTVTMILSQITYVDALNLVTKALMPQPNLLSRTDARDDTKTAKLNIT